MRRSLERNDNDIYNVPVTDGNPNIAIPLKTHVPIEELPKTETQKRESRTGKTWINPTETEKTRTSADVEHSEIDDIGKTPHDETNEKGDVLNDHERANDVQNIDTLENKAPKKLSIDIENLTELPPTVDIEENLENGESEEIVDEKENTNDSDINDSDIIEEEQTVSLEEYQKLEQRIEILTKDFEIAKKRQQVALKEKEMTANMNLIKVLLPIFDDLDKALEYSLANELDTMDVTGVANIRKKMIGALSNEGLVIINPEGEAFDMNEHQAIDRIQTDGEADMVVKVYQVGYKLHDKIIRPALVSVSY